ncbi:MAG: hypothetical protein CL484_06050 [Acidobacteria bacterium]|nr:hypothetical protein [Acidobacteriota bacterium]|tara:strand:- start:46 stop:546 length:501 start_codon:yes stop_codon:yes gene_type:complete
MRDAIAGLFALGLLIFALGLMSTLRFHQRSRERRLYKLSVSGRSVIAEIPAKNSLELFTSDKDHFFWRESTIHKEQILLVRVLINGSPLTSYFSKRHQFEEQGDSGSFADRPEGIAHDRWDILIRTPICDTLIECGSIRERVSQELARRVFDTVKVDMERRDAAIN